MRGLRPTAGDTSHKADSMFVRHLASQPLVQNTGAIVEERCRPKRFVRAGNHIAPGCSAIHRRERCAIPNYSAKSDTRMWAIFILPRHQSSVTSRSRLQILVRFCPNPMICGAMRAVASPEGW